MPGAPAVEVAFRYPEPIGRIAVAANGDVFFTVHSASRPQGNKLLRIRDGVAEPFPDGAAQQKLLATPLGLALDGRGRLWVLDHGNHGRAPARLLAFDAASGDIAHEHTFEREIAPLGSFLQSIAVSRDGSAVFIGDTSLFRRRPALVVHDPAAGTARRVLERAMPLTAQGFRIDAKGRPMRFFGGLLSVMPGVAGLALDARGQWLYVGATSHDGLYRIATEMLLDETVAPATLAGAIERYSDKPLSEGMAMHPDDTLFVTDVEHGAVVRIGIDRRPRAFAAPEALRWAGAVDIGPDGAVWFADSALQHWLFGGPTRVESGAPYAIYRATASPAP